METKEKLGSVLIVDDEILIRDMLELELNSGYNVHTAENAKKAYEILKDTAIDLVISDINMPDIKGYELVKKIKDKYPNTKTALITAYDINNYIKMAKENDVSNIIAKSVPFNFEEFNSVVKSLITEEIFGLKRYMLHDFKILGEYTVQDSRQIRKVGEEIIEIISGFIKPDPSVNVLLHELISNAVYHAPADKNGNIKYLKNSQVTLEDTEAVKVYIGKDSEKYGVSITDPSGRLTKEKALYNIDRHINGEGVLDENGRGLHISRSFSDRFIINIKKNVATEAIFINYIIKKYQSSKPLYINEI